MQDQMDKPKDLSEVDLLKRRIIDLEAENDSLRDKFVRKTCVTSSFLYVLNSKKTRFLVGFSWGTRSGPPP